MGRAQLMYIIHEQKNGTVISSHSIRYVIVAFLSQHISLSSIVSLNLWY